MRPGPPPPETARLAARLPFFVVAAACLWNFAAYAAEVLVPAPPLNDDVFHLGLIRRMHEAWAAGGNPLDTWIGYWGQGFPVLRYYQHLPHFAVVLVHRLLGGAVPLETVYGGIKVLLLALAPLAFYAGTRRLGASPLAAAGTALVVPLLGADPAMRHFLGFQPASFLWSGSGLFAQLAAMVLLPLALGSTVRAALDGRRYAGAIAWLAATWLSHLVLGYTACLLGLLVLLHPEARGRRTSVALRLGGLYLATAAVASYLLLPTLLESAWIARSVWEPAEYWDSYGAARALAALAGGGLLDGSRFPALTLLAAIGALSAVAMLIDRRRAGRGYAMLALGVFSVGLALFFGRPTWGRALELLPFSASLPFHRFVCAVQLGGVLLAGLGLARIAEFALRRRDLRVSALAAVAVIALLAPAVASTAAFAAKNVRWRAEAAAAWSGRGADVDRALDAFASQDAAVPGRGYAGTSWDWGRDFRIGSVNVYHRWAAHGLPAISYMYHTMGRLSELETDFDPARRDHYELFNVRWLLAPAGRGLPAFATPRPAGPGLAAGIVDTGGYFAVVGSAAFLPVEAADPAALRALNRAFIAGRWHEAGWFVRLGTKQGEAARAGEAELGEGRLPDFGHAPPQRAPRGAVLSGSGAGDRYEAHVRLDEPALVLFRMTWHPHWRAAIDGERAETAMLSPGYVGVAVPAGEHRLTVSYRPPAWTRAALISGLLLLAAIAAAEAVSSRSGRRQSRQAA